ncbi:hypothetical protein [Methylobacterium gregans]|uniref:Uncharacterized protein n=1 Tax=Methylobacterium gregans TaxID=374424 RepID=A0AA37M9V6_9HYPH|nr:hypothetical protein [Methylobacterium gregans]MDQ0522013.1 hypothetical protein [Methylobacterium gregans]GJD77955.1 hypothetical protein NBEOAGPD_1167 [Methylobacterium gregans]GLS51925.1 hypothetical protein GCM10007886_01070 [Methylobacterium gregans]
MQAHAHAPWCSSNPDADLLPWFGLEPEALEDAARSLCAVRPGNCDAERLMERAAYLRATRIGHTEAPQRASALFLG